MFFPSAFVREERGTRESAGDRFQSTLRLQRKAADISNRTELAKTGFRLDLWKPPCVKILKTGRPRKDVIAHHVVRFNHPCSYNER